MKTLLLILVLHIGTCMPYINDYNLINAKEADINAENTPLWSVQYYYLCKKLGYQQKCDSILINLVRYLGLVKVQPGLYNNLPFTPENKKDIYTSPDQLIAYLSVLKITGNLVEIKAIRSYLRLHLGTYDNTKPSLIGVNLKRIMHPMVYAYAGALLGNKIDTVILKLMNSFTMRFSEGTSGKLKVWVMKSTLQNEALGGDWLDIFRVYHYEQNPVREMAEEVYSEV